MYQKYLWLIVFCGCGVASCITYIVCLLCHERRKSKHNGKQTLVINLDE